MLPGLMVVGPTCSASDEARHADTNVRSDFWSAESPVRGAPGTPLALTPALGERGSGTEAKVSVARVVRVQA